MGWIIENANWVFSGIGVSVLSLIGGVFIKNKFDKNNTQKIKSGDNSTNIQGGENVTVTIGGKSDEEKSRN